MSSQGLLEVLGRGKKNEEAFYSSQEFCNKYSSDYKPPPPPPPILMLFHTLILITRQRFQNLYLPPTMKLYVINVLKVQ
ncbi:unnamed protein product [Brassica oleracea]